MHCSQKIIKPDLPKHSLLLYTGTFLSLFSPGTVYAADLSNLSPDSVLNKTTALIFNLMTWGGVILMAAGITRIVRSLNVSAEENSGGLPRGISLVISGIAMIAVRGVIGCGDAVADLNDPFTDPDESRGQ